MKAVEERLRELMAKGYDISIKGKGVGRNYAMTYEATAMHSSPVAPEGECRVSWMMMQSHAVADSLDELLDKLEANFGRGISTPESKKDIGVEFNAGL